MQVVPAFLKFKDLQTVIFNSNDSGGKKAVKLLICNEGTEPDVGSVKSQIKIPTAVINV